MNVLLVIFIVNIKQMLHLSSRTSSLANFNVLHKSNIYCAAKLEEMPRKNGIIFPLLYPCTSVVIRALTLR